VSLGKARAAIAGPGVQELVADPAVEAHALGHVLDVGAGAFAERRDLVDEADLGGEEGVGRVLDHLGGLERRVDDGKVAQEERTVDIAHDAAGAAVLGADDDAVGAHEVVDRRALAQEFGVRGDVEIGLRAGAADHLGHLAVGADGDGGLGDDDRVAGQRLPDLLGRGHHVAEVGMAVAAPRGGADGDEDRGGAIDGGGQVGGEAEPARRDVAGHHVLEPGLVDRHLAALELGHLLGRLVDADDLVAEIRETHP